MAMNALAPVPTCCRQYESKLCLIDHPHAPARPGGAPMHVLTETYHERNRVALCAKAAVPRCEYPIERAMSRQEYPE